MNLTSVFHASVIDHEFRHNIVKVADYFDNVMTKFVVNNRTDALKTDILLFTNYKFMCLSAYWQYKLTNELARISAVTLKINGGRAFTSIWMPGNTTVKRRACANGYIF